MSEEKQSFMQALDAWIDVNVIAPLVYQSEDEPEELGDDAIDNVKKAIKGKVLQSYRNGLATGAHQPAREPRKVYQR